eukprot:gene25485-11143_t
MPAPISPKKGPKGKARRGTKDQVDASQGEYVPPPPPMPGDEFAMPTREVVRPDNQLPLSETDLNEEIAKMLTANNPEAPKNVARFNVKEKTYKFEPMVEQTIVHYATDGWMLYKGSEEAKKQLDFEKMENDASQRFQWGIYDEYVKDLERQRIEDASKVKGGKKPAGGAPAATSAPAEPAPAKEKDSSDIFESEDMVASAQIMDRMANQNMFEEIAADYKYWEDSSDAFRRRQVTAICWNPQYLDLFAVGYGSYDFLKQSSGLICIYSLKNPSYPEFYFTTDSGVMCLDFHPEYANLMAVGCYDGTVHVYDVHQKVDKPIYSASVKTGKHNDPVWSIFWQVDDAVKALQFASVSSDGSINLWTMNKSELTHEDLMKLKVVGPGKQLGEPEDDGTAAAPAGGCCLDFCKMPGQEHIYLVGTEEEEGTIHKCYKAYSSQYPSTYLGHELSVYAATSYQCHELSVYAVKWNHLHPRTFLSASADWSVKVWDTESPKKPVMSFDLGDTVGDLAWAPYSATVFAAVTDEGKVCVFDLYENKLLPMCSQKIVKKAKLTKIVFHPKHPMILVGDDKGTVTSLKLSPNLRSPGSLPSEDEKEKSPPREQVEVARLEEVLEVARKSEVEAEA